MTGFELRIFGIWSDRITNCATTTSLTVAVDIWLHRKTKTRRTYKQFVIDLKCSIYNKTSSKWTQKFWISLLRFVVVVVDVEMNRKIILLRLPFNLSHNYSEHDG